MGREAGGAQLLTMVTHVVSQQPLSGKPLGAVRALEALLWAGQERKGWLRRRWRQRGEGVPERGASQAKGNHPEETGEFRELGWTRYRGKSVGLGMENLN